MARLPQVGGDVGNWGTLLNEYLSVSHNTDGSLKNQVVNVKDFGAKGDYGTTNTDDTAAIQKAFDTITSGILFFPKGIYKITGTITLTNKKGITLQGEGKYATRIQWSATNKPGLPVVKVVNGRDISFLDMGISGLAIAINPQGVVVNNSLPSALIEMQANYSIVQPGGNPSMARFENLYLNEKGGANASDKGIVFTKVGTTIFDDFNNDVGFFKRVQIAQTITAGVSFEHSQSKAHTFINCNFGGGKYGITTALGIGDQGGSFRWISGSMGNHAEADFYLGQPNDPITISGVYSEDSKRLLVMKPISHGTWPVVVEGVRYAANGVAADGIVIDFRSWGLFVLRNSSFGSSSVPVKLKFTANGQMVASIYENFFGTKGSSNVELVITEGRGPFAISRLNNLYATPEGHGVTKPDDSINQLLERIKILEARP